MRRSGGSLPPQVGKIPKGFIDEEVFCGRVRENAYGARPRFHQTLRCFASAGKRGYSSRQWPDSEQRDHWLTSLS